MNKWLLGSAGVLVVLVLMVMGFYNSLISVKEKVDNQWAQVQTQYQRRFDLVPNLVATVKGVAKQEQEVFGMIADARTRYSGALSTDDKVAAANQLETAIGRLLVVVENYPQLKSADSYQTLMSQLEGTENRVNVERVRFNDAIKEYNLAIKRFPGSMLAKIMGFAVKGYFEATPTAQTAPAVNF